MNPIYSFFFLTGIYPLYRAWVCQRHTSLGHAVLWAAAAWLGWAVLLSAEALGAISHSAAAHYAALCLIGCSGVAVLGARRPGVGAWNFVVLGLLAVFILSWAEGLLAGGTLKLGELRLLFLVGTLGVGILNYLPTRLGPAAVLVAIGCGIEVQRLLDPPASERLPADWPVTTVILGLAPWIAWALLHWQRLEPQPFDRLWRDFRDHYGFVWGSRVCEQFNRSAANAGWPVELRWQGLRPIPPAAIDAELHLACLTTLQALLKRFGADSSETVKGNAEQ